MLAPIVSSDDNKDSLATRTTELASADRTRTKEPTWQTKPASPSLPDPRRAVGTHARDPERYQILAEHGRGGLGRVSRAHDCELGRDVAIKELLSRDHVGEVRFLREALITARLEHPASSRSTRPAGSPTAPAAAAGVTSAMITVAHRIGSSRRNGH